jgi:hypothetical protein
MTRVNHFASATSVILAIVISILLLGCGRNKESLEAAPKDRENASQRFVAALVNEQPKRAEGLSEPGLKFVIKDLIAVVRRNQLRVLGNAKYHEVCERATGVTVSGPGDCFFYRLKGSPVVAKNGSVLTAHGKLYVWPSSNVPVRIISAQYLGGATVRT